MFCPHCHNKIPDGSNFCPLCYANLVGVRQRETESAERFEEEEKPRPAQKAAPKKSAKPAYSKGSRKSKRSQDKTPMIIAIGLILILVLIIVRVTPLNTFFPWIEKQGLTIGIIILTIGVMAPIASGTLPASTLLHSFVNWKSLVAIAVGIFVSWLGGRGVTLMSSQPSLVAGLLVGTVLGVALFRGVPVGPLIAAGLVSLFIGKS